MFLKITMFVLTVAVLVCAYSSAAAQCTTCAQISPDDPQVSIDPSGNGNVIVQVPGSDPRGIIVIPAGGGIVIGNSCESLIIEVPSGKTARFNLKQNLQVTVNNKRMPPSASMDPLPFEIKFPHGGSIVVQSTRLSGSKRFAVSVGGTDVSVRQVPVTNVIR